MDKKYKSAITSEIIGLRLVVGHMTKWHAGVLALVL
jgi:hypothetical protein